MIGNELLKVEPKEAEASETVQAPKPTWRRPKLQRLRLSLDTANSVGSATDGGGRPTFTGV